MTSLLIIGSGALATLFAQRLSSAGFEIWMLGSWQAALEALNRDGACVDYGGTTRRCAPVRAVSRADDCPRAQAALVLVKSWQTQRAAAQLARILPPEAFALTLQNGLGNVEILAAALGAERVLVGVTTTGAALTAPGTVRFGGEGLVSMESRPGAEWLSEALRRSGFQVQTLSSAQSLLWKKLAVNTAINPLTALLEVPNGALLSLPDTASLMDALARETAAVAAAAGYPLSEDAAAAAHRVARQTAENFSSMLQDIRRGAPTEIEAICGAVVQHGKKHHLPTPLNEVFLRLIRAKAARKLHT